MLPTVSASAPGHQGHLRRTSCAPCGHKVTVVLMDTTPKPDTDAVLAAYGRPFLPGCPEMLLQPDETGRWHQPGCGHLPDGRDVSASPSIGDILGPEVNLCDWVRLPDVWSQAAALLVAYAEFSQPELPQVQRPKPDDAAGWARAVMTRRRVLNELSARLRSWQDTHLGPTPDGYLTLDAAITSSSDPAHDLAVVGGCCAACGVNRALVGRILTDLHESAAGRWQAVTRSEPSRRLLAAVTTDMRAVTMVLDQYSVHHDHTLDADLADAVVAAYTAVRHGSRVALRLPFGLAGFVAIHRDNGGFSEVDRDGQIPDDVLETAMVLWDPESQGPYRRWPAALQAARLLR